MINKLTTLTQKFSPSLLKIISNTAWLFADNILRMGAGLVVGAWVARYLQPEQFGRYNYAMAFVTLFGAVASLGLDQIVIRDIVRDPSSKDKILGTAFILKLIGGVAALLLAVGVVSRLRPGDSLTLWLVGIISLSMTFRAFDVIDFWFQSQVQSKYTVWAKNVVLIVSSLVKILLIQLKAPLIAFAWIYSAEFVLVALGLIIAYKSKGYVFKAWRYSLNCAKGLLKDSWTIILSGFMIVIYMRTDQIMLGQLVGDSAVGVYSVAVRISELWYFVPMAISNSVYPSIIEARQISEKLYYERLQKLFSLMTFLSYIVAIVGSLIAGQLITLLFGKGYEAAIPILIVHIWAGIFVSLGVIRSLWTTTEGLMQFAFATTAVGGIINIILNFILIKPYGGLGSAIATVISQAFASYIAGAFFSKTRKIFILQTKSFITPNPMLILRKFL